MLEKKSRRTNRHGGPRPGSGRPKGRKDAKTLEIEAEARPYGHFALKALVRLVKCSKSDSVRVAAAIAILDRGYGRPRQAVALTDPDGNALEVTVRRVLVRP